MNIIVTIRDKEYVATIKEVKAFCDKMVTVGANTIVIDGEPVEVDHHEAKDLHRQIHEELYV